MRANAPGQAIVDRPLAAKPAAQLAQLLAQKTFAAHE